MIMHSLSSDVATKVDLQHSVCLHCRQKLLPSQFELGFCCHGCRLAHSFIKSLNLENFYDLVQVEQMDKAQELDDQSLDLFDSKEFQEGFCERKPHGGYQAKLYVGGLSCYACVWLIENALKKKWPRVTVSLSLSSGECKISVDHDDLKLSAIVGFIRKLGFLVVPSRRESQVSNIKDLVRLGVATFCFLNIMLLSVPDYLDSNMVHDQVFWNVFRGISLFLGTIAVFYGAQPIFRSAWRAIVCRKTSIDQSLSLALFAAFVYSTWNTLRMSGDVYFDSVAAIITLIGWGRYFQKRIIQNAENTIYSIFDYSTRFVRKKIGSTHEWKRAPLTQVRKGDILTVLPGEPVTVQSELISPRACISLEQINGEPQLHAISQGQELTSGAVIYENPVDVISRQDGTDSFIVKINAMLEKIFTEKGKLSLLSDQFASLFFLFVGIVSAIIFYFGFQVSLEEAFSRSIAALLIACPCAFAIAVPLTMASCAAQGLKNGIVLKSQSSIEKLSRISNLYFDKTGTLTSGAPSISLETMNTETCERLQLDVASVYDVFISLSALSQHHTLKALESFIVEKGLKRGKVDIQEFREENGQGVSFRCLGFEWKVGRPSYCLRGGRLVDATFCCTVEGELLAAYQLEDQLIDDAFSTVSYFQNQGVVVGIISGDQTQKTHNVAAQLAIPQSHIFSEQSLYQKRVILDHEAQGQVNVMVGNGFNDSLAMAASDVGVCVSVANERAKELSAVYLKNPGLTPLVVAHKLAEVARKKIMTAFLFAAAFNSFGLILAGIGLMHPVVAAIMMPISSVSVILISSRGWGRHSKDAAADAAREA